MLRKLIRIETLGVLFAFILLWNLLMVKPIVGVADNGDFGRIMHSTGLQHIPTDYRDRYFGYVNREFAVTEPKPGPASRESYFSTGIPLIAAAKLLCRIMTGSDGIFDIRYLAFIYICIFLTAFYLLVRSSRSLSLFSVLVLVGLLLLIFTDVGYVAYFNSLYGEAVSFTSLLLTIALAILLVRREKPGFGLLACYFLAAILLTGGKAQNAPLGLILALFSLRLCCLRGDPAWKRLIRVLCILLVLLAVKSYTSIPENIRVCNKYQSVFYGAIKGSPTPEKDLLELGLDPKLSVLAGTNYFMREYPLDIHTPAIQQQLTDRISPLKTALFYLTHPARYFEKLELTAFYGFKLVEGFGSYEKAEGKEFGAVVQSFRTWSNFKMNILPHSLWLLLVFFFLYFLILAHYYWKIRHSPRDRIFLEILLLVWLTGILQFVIPVIADGEADLSKHLFLFNACFDIMFVASSVWLAVMVERTAWRLKRLLSPQASAS